MQQFLSRCIAGEAKAWQQFFEEYHPLISGTVRSRTDEPVECDDLVQEIYCELVKQDYRLLRKFTGDDRPAFLVYLKRVCENVIRTKCRKLFRQNLAEVPYDGALHDSASEENDLEKLYIRQENNTRLIEQINSLEQTSREILFLLHKGYKHRQIAAILGIPVNTSLTKANRAMKKLKKTLDSEIIFS